MYETRYITKNFYAHHTITLFSQEILTFGMIIYGKFFLQEDLYYPHTVLQMLLWNSLSTFTEPLLSRWPLNKLRERALQITMDHIHYEDECSRYITIGCVEKVMEFSSTIYENDQLSMEIWIILFVDPYATWII